MNKKVNTLFFILSATVVNIVLTVASFLVLFILYAKFLAPHLSETAAAWGFPVIFIAAIAIAFISYRGLLKLLLKKVDPEKYFDPLFAPRRGRR